MLDDLKLPTFNRRNYTRFNNTYPWIDFSLC